MGRDAEGGSIELGEQSEPSGTQPGPVGMRNKSEKIWYISLQGYKGGGEMSVGTGIFLSSIFIGIVVLYLSTKDRWNWKRGAKWLGLAFVAVCIIGGIGVWGFLHTSQPIIDSLSMPKVQTNLWELELGMSEADLIFKKGKAITNVSRKNDKQTILYDYKDREGRWFVGVSNKKVVSIMLVGEKFSFRKLQDISFGSSLDQLTDKFGEPTRMKEADDHTARTFFFDKYNLMFWLEKGKVIGYGITSQRPK